MNTDENSAQYRLRKALNIEGLFIYLEQLVLNNQNVFSENMIKEIHRKLMDGLLETAGSYRCNGIAIKGSPHLPPPSENIQDLLLTMCSTVNRMHSTQTSLTVTIAYVLWRFNWIHPFENGNGRTARSLAHYILLRYLASRKLVSENLKSTLDFELSVSRQEYFNALQAADQSLQTHGQVDLSDLEKLIATCLRRMIFA